MLQMNLFASQNRDAEVESETDMHTGSRCKGTGGTNWERSTDTDTLACAKQTASGELRHSTGAHFGAL